MFDLHPPLLMVPHRKTPSFTILKHLAYHTKIQIFYFFIDKTPFVRIMFGMRRRHSIRIPVHGFVEFDDWERDVINHPVFQRLRRIRQLAFTDHIYPGSTHSRFEHSLGVMHIATRLYDAIVKKYGPLLEDRLGYNPEKSNAKKLIRMSALLHDVGHAPCSHTGEKLLPQKQSGKRFSHEEYTAELIRHEMKDVIDDHNINRREQYVSASDIADFYLGKPRFGAEILFWRVLVTGQLDSDRMDYLLRDSLHCGVAYGHYDLDRIIDTVAIVANESPDLHTDLQIAISEGGRHAAEGLVLARYFMFQQVYFHPVRQAYNHHTEECLKQMLGSCGQGDVLPTPTTESERKKFLQLDDWELLRFIKQGEDRHAHALLNHKHDRLVYNTPEIASKEQLEEHKEIFHNLCDEGIDAWISDADKEWYKINKSEIQIATESNNLLEARTGNPLSEVSNVIQNLDETKQRLIFVPIEDLKKSKDIVKKKGK